MILSIIQMIISKEIVNTNLVVSKQKKHFPKYFQKVVFLIYLNKITTLLHNHFIAVDNIYTLRQNSYLSYTFVITGILHNQS